MIAVVAFQVAVFLVLIGTGAVMFGIGVVVLIHVADVRRDGIRAQAGLPPYPSRDARLAELDRLLETGVIGQREHALRRAQVLFG